ncbi:hypothetical protein D3C73_1203530 [compost metagenome]
MLLYIILIYIDKFRVKSAKYILNPPGQIHYSIFAHLHVICEANCILKSAALHNCHLITMNWIIDKVSKQLLHFRNKPLCLFYNRK